MSVHVRHADAKRDAAGVAAIYNDAVEHTTAIWNDATVDPCNRLAWITDRQVGGHPVLVAADEGDEVIGYASFGDWRPWAGYRHTVEHSVYVRADRRGGGVGHVLMERLIDEARRAGKHVMVAGIESSNVGSIRLHRRLGFQHAGRLTEVGTKFGQWLDLTFLQLLLDDPHRSPCDEQDEGRAIETAEHRRSPVRGPSGSAA